MTTQQQLQQLFMDNFMAYFRSHVAHVNIQGRTFYSDHKLLGKIYEDLQEQIDLIAELLRSQGEFMPDNLFAVCNDSNIADVPVGGSSDEMLMDIRDTLFQLKGTTEELIAVADDERLLEISNYAQDRVLALSKFLWMIDSTLGQSNDEPNDEPNDD